MTNDEIIPMPASPGQSTTEASTPTLSDLDTSDTAPSSAGTISTTEDSRAPLEQKRTRNDKELQLGKQLKKCRDKTLESELCRTITKYASKLMSDDQYRRGIAIGVLVLAVVGLIHILALIF